MKKLNYIDLFAGCGGLSLGFHQANLQGLFAIEKSIDAFKTLEANLIDEKNHFNWPSEVLKKNYDINSFLKTHLEYLKTLKGKVDLIAGGPPCQGFSTAGKRIEKDQRNSLIFSYLKFVEIISPKMILFENVHGFTLEFKANKKSSGGINYSEYVIKKLEELGYKVDFRLVDFSKFGVPQKRKRFILVGVKNRKNNFFENLEISSGEIKKKYKLKNQTTIHDALSDLLKNNGCSNKENEERFSFGLYSSAASPYQKLMRKGLMRSDLPDSHRFANHNSDVQIRFKKLINYNLKYGSIDTKLLEKLGTKKKCVTVLSAKNQSPTLTTLPDDLIHFSEPRILTVREYARLQSFPDWYRFKGKYTTGGQKRKIEVPRYSQIGNAIPPLFAEICGGAIYKTLTAS